MKSMNRVSNPLVYCGLIFAVICCCCNFVEFAAAAPLTEALTLQREHSPAAAESSSPAVEADFAFQNPSTSEDGATKAAVAAAVATAESSLTELRASPAVDAFSSSSSFQDPLANEEETVTEEAGQRMSAAATAESSLTELQASPAVDASSSSSSFQDPLADEEETVTAEAGQLMSAAATEVFVAELASALEASASLQNFPIDENDEEKVEERVAAKPSEAASTAVDASSSPRNTSANNNESVADEAKEMESAAEERSAAEPASPADEPIQELVRVAAEFYMAESASSIRKENASAYQNESAGERAVEEAAEPLVVSASSLPDVEASFQGPSFTEMGATIEAMAEAEIIAAEFSSATMATIDDVSTSFEEEVEEAERKSAQPSVSEPSTFPEEAASATEEAKEVGTAAATTLSEVLASSKPAEGSTKAETTVGATMDANPNDVENSIPNAIPNAIADVEAAGASTEAPPKGDCTAKLSVMNYNTRQLPMFLVINDWDQGARLKRLPDTMRQPEYQADILILDELMTESAFTKVQELSDVYPYITTVVGRDCSGKDLTSLKGPCSKLLPRSGVMALSKFPILETHGLIFKYAASGTWDAKCNKGAIYLKVSVNGLIVHVVGTHVQADEGGVDGGPTRVLQMQQLREWMGTFPIPKDEPIILTGDINSELGSEEQHTIFDGNFVFKFVKHDYGTFSSSTNWLARADAYAAKSSLYAEKHLDYVATWADHLQPIRPAFMSIIKLKAKEKWYWSYLEGWWHLHEGMFHHDGYYNDVSDHYPVVANFEFPVHSCTPRLDDNSIEAGVLLLD